MTVTAPDQHTRLAPPAAGMDAFDLAIEAACRTLRLPTIRDTYAEHIEAALKEPAGFKQFLAELLQIECDERDERSRQRRVKDANFPRPKRVEEFSFADNPNIAPEVVASLTDPGWVTAGKPLVLIGDPGTGKSHLLIGIGTAIAEAGYRVRYSTAVNLVNELSEAADDKQLTRVLARYNRVDLLCLDEFGYLELDKKGAKLLFQVFTDREETRSIAVASNSPFDEWQKSFVDPRLSQAIVERLTFKGHIIYTGTESYRFAQTQAEQAAAQAAARAR